MTNELRHTPKLQLLSAFLAAAMTLTTLPAAAFAADVTDYELAVNGKRVTSANATNILDDGKASYDADTRTLTLSGDISVTDQCGQPIRKAADSHRKKHGDRSTKRPLCRILQWWRTNQSGC